MGNAKKVAETAVIVAVIAVVWSVMSLVVIFYYLPRAQDSTSGNGVNPQLSCTPTEYVYTGEVCKDTLLALKQCIFNQPPDNREDVGINISTATDLLISEQLSTLGVQYLQTLAPSQECVAVLVPFLCQYLFTPCDERGVAYYPSSEDCVYIRDQVCAREWEEITGIPTVAGYLPNCESLPNDTQCNIDPTVTADNGSTDSTNVSSPLMCSEGFVYIEEVHQCRPHCPSWEEYEHGVNITYHVIFAASVAVSVLASIAVLFLSCVRYKNMFTFPSVLIVYQNISYLIVGIIILIGSTDREALFCNSQDWLEVLNSRGTPFCALNAVVTYYVAVQTVLWWFFHILTVFCGIVFPLRTQSFKASGRMKYVHTGLVIAGILIPAIPVTVIASVDGYFPTTFPPFYCVSASSTALFYAIVLPLCTLLAIGISLIVGMIWRIVKGYRRFNRSEQAKGDVRKVIIKLLILFSYFSLVCVMILTVFLVSYRNTSYGRALTMYFLCEGDPSTMKCDRKSFQQHSTAPLYFAAFTLFIIYPLFCLLYAVNIRELRESISVACVAFNKLKNKLSTIHPTAKQVNNQLPPPALELALCATSDSVATLQTFASTNTDL